MEELTESLGYDMWSDGGGVGVVGGVGADERGKGGVGGVACTRDGG